MSETVRNILVRKSTVVNAPLAFLFEFFTRRQNEWWPRNHHIGGKEPFTAIMEPRAGGRWYERADDGSECGWGKVLVWEPPVRVVFTWDIGADWKYDPSLGTEVELTFAAEGPECTRVRLEHRKLERYADKAETMRAMFDSEDAWPATLSAFAKAAESARAERAV